MRSTRVFHAVESHTEGMPTRVITGGVGTIPGATMAERRQWFAAHRDDIRTLLMYEPRGHSAMSGAIGVATVLVETGMVEVTEPVTTLRLDVPAGLVTAEVAVQDGAARSVTIRNVPSFTTALDERVEVPGFGEVTYDMAFGGNFYAIVPLERLGLPFNRAAANELLAAGLAVMRAINEQRPPRHPERPDITGCHHVYLEAPGSTAAHSRHAMVIHPGWFDRSPCGTGTSARMAQLHARGLLPLQREFVNESFIGSRFTGRLLGETAVGGVPAVLPAITGRAWVTGTAQYHLDPTDPFPAGFLL
ncbi:proline racemase family protein [Streptomyces sp. 7-21]|uniref:proline racemase family protein n=1 Tax=Streptomyces sp. 7-21 TaxID=2802283 RepID=UPI0019202338|nr:proline racemase family protein [Streptomyces sp. 7-21]MBL1066408.1 proline racemase family protein [Streptomyces sp. 7-21]